MMPRCFGQPNSQTNNLSLSIGGHTVWNRFTAEGGRGSDLPFVFLFFCNMSHKTLQREKEISRGAGLFSLLKIPEKKRL